MIYLISDTDSPVILKSQGVILFVIQLNGLLVFLVCQKVDQITCDLIDSLSIVCDSVCSCDSLTLIDEYSEDI